MISRRAPRPGGRATGAERPADPAAARTAAAALLARRDFASTELDARLIARGYEPPVATEAVAGLAAQGVLSDERFAHDYVASRAGRGHGPLRIAAELRARGLAAALIEAALAAAVDWRALAGAARARRFGKAPPASWKEKARQARFLQYRGFSADHIRAATGIDPDTD
jgi:regulatory protein